MGKRKDLSVFDKVELLNRFEKLRRERPKISLREAAEKLDVTKSFLHKIKQQEADLRLKVIEDGSGQAKRKRHGKDDQVEKALLEFYHWAKSKNIPLNGPLLMEKAKAIAVEAGVMNFRPTDGWFSRWKKRNGLVFVTSRGEAAEADTSIAQHFLDIEFDDDVEAIEDAPADKMTDSLVQAVAEAKRHDQHSVDSDEEQDEKEPLVTVKEMHRALEVLEMGYKQNDFKIAMFEASMKEFREHLRDKFPPKPAIVDSCITWADAPGPGCPP